MQTVSIRVRERKKERPGERVTLSFGDDNYHGVDHVILSFHHRTLND